MFALRLTTCCALVALAACTPLAYHALTDEATGSVLIFPASRSAPAPMSDLRGIPEEPVKKEENTKGFLSSWWKPETRPVAWQPPSVYHGQYEYYDPYYHNGAYHVSPYPNRYQNQYNKYPDKNHKFHELLDKFHGLYNDKQDKIHGLYNDKQDKLHALYHDKYGPYHGYPGDYYGPYPSGYHGGYHGYHNAYPSPAWGVGASHRYPHSDRPYEYGYEGGPYDG